MIYWASGGPVSQQLHSAASGCWYFPAGSRMTNGRLRHLSFRVPNDRASSSINGWKPLVILVGKGKKSAGEHSLQTRLVPNLMQSCNSSSSTEFYNPPLKKKTHRPLLTSPHSLDLRLDTGLWIGGISAGWLGAKSPWLPQSSNWLFHILLCPGIICLCSARTGWDQMSLACTVKVSYPHLGPSKMHFWVVERACGLVGLNRGNDKENHKWGTTLLKCPWATSRCAASTCAAPEFRWIFEI